MRGIDVKSLLVACLIAIVVSGFSLAGIMQFGLAPDSTITVSASNSLNVQLETVADGQALFTNETSHTNSYSAKLVIPKDARQGSCAFALYPYNKPLSSISTFSVFASFKNAVPVFVFRLDKNGDGIAEISLMSDYPFASNGEWKATTVGNRWGWTEAYNQLSVYGKTWNPLDYWKDQYGNATVLYIGIALEYWAVEPYGLGEAMYADELTVNGATYNIVPAPSPSSTPSLGTLNVELQHRYDGQALFTNEKVHTSPQSVRLVIPKNAAQGSYAMALYPYNGTLNSISSFSIIASYTKAVPRFMLCIDQYGRGWADTFLLSDYQFASNGEWKTTTGGNRWGWTETNIQLTSYGSTWGAIDFWATKYGDRKVLYIGILLEYWAVDPDGFGEPLYADELIINGVTYNIAPVSTAAPSPAKSVNITDSNSWPMFHNDLAHSGYSKSTGPLTNQTLWKYQTGSSIESSPAVVDGVVYIGSEDQNFYALRASDGAQIWHFATGGYIDSSPVVVGDVVYFGSRDGYVYALNVTDGFQIWSFRARHGNWGSYYYSTPAVANGVIYVGSYDSSIYALNATNGSIFWEFRTGGYIFSSPVVAGAVVYVGSYDGNVYALDAITGSKIWSYQTGGKMRSSCAVVNGTVYVGSDDGYLYAFGSPNNQPTTSYKISGSILDANGHGIEGAHIIFNVPQIVPSVSSGPSGYYVISAPAGTYHVNVWPPFDSNYINYDEPGFVVGSDMTKNITLQSGCKVSGYISFSNGTPVVGAAVLLKNSVNTFGSGWFSNSVGYYFLSVPAGTYTIIAYPRTGNYYSGPTTDFPTYYEYNFTVNGDTIKNITVGGSPPTSSPNSALALSLTSSPASSPEPSVSSSVSSPEFSSTPPVTVMPAQITVPTKAATISLLGIVLGIVIVATPIVAVISVCLLFYFKKRNR